MLDAAAELIMRRDEREVFSFLCWLLVGRSEHNNQRACNSLAVDEFVNAGLTVENCDLGLDAGCARRIIALVVVQRALAARATLQSFNAEGFRCSPKRSCQPNIQP